MLSNQIKYAAILECPAPVPMDILFILDGSSSIKGNFWRVKKWVNSVTEKFNISNGITQVGVIQYSHWYSYKY